MSKNRLRLYTLWYEDENNADEEIEKKYGITIEELQRVCREKLEKLGCTKQTIDGNIGWDEFLYAVYYHDDDLEYWRKCNVFGDYIKEMDFVMSMTTD